jgi:thioredoxin-like negative regulator of GroEL
MSENTDSQENEKTTEKEPEFILIGSEENCPPCDEIRELLKDQIEDGTVKYVELNSEEGLKYAEELQNVAIPYAVRTKDGKECDIFADKETVLVRCKDEEEVTALAEPEPPATSDQDDSENTPASSP